MRNSPEIRRTAVLAEIGSPGADFRFQKSISLGKQRVLSSWVMFDYLGRAAVSLKPAAYPYISHRLYL